MNTVKEREFKVSTVVETVKLTKTLVLDQVFYGMANKEKCDDKLKDVPVKSIPGVSDIVLYPVVGMTEGKIPLLPILTEYLAPLDITVEELYEAAQKNTEKQVKICSLNDYIRAISNVNVGKSSPFIAAYDNTEFKNNGKTYQRCASVFGAPKKLKSLKGECYVIPSSTNEILFLPKELETDPKHLLGVIKDANGVLDHDLVLSENLYEFSNGEFSLCEIPKEE